MVATVSRGRGRRTINEINMVPFIDVMLVLLIIFMVTAPLISPSVIDLPSIGKANKQPDKVVQVVISLSGKSAEIIDSSGVKIKDVAIKNIATIVKEKQKGDAKIPVVISADKTVNYATVIDVMNSMQKADIQRVGLSVQLAK
ncbi:MAG: biopolymer transporter ExbD [Burkholderiaceae bacterium]